MHSAIGLRALLDDRHNGPWWQPADQWRGAVILEADGKCAVADLHTDVTLPNRHPRRLCHLALHVRLLWLHLGRLLDLLCPGSARTYRSVHDGSRRVA
jgi:hypothetical protein